MLLESAWSAFLAATAASSAAFLLSLALRIPMRFAFGARVAYAIWLIVPLSLLALLWPAARLPVASAPVVRDLLPLATNMIAAATASSEVFNGHALAVALWLVGTALVIVRWGVGYIAFARGLKACTTVDAHLQSMRTDLSPMVFGLWRTRIVLPHDFAQRFDADEQRLVLAHEQAHLRGHDVRVNAFAALLLAFNWFNPLAWWSWWRFRFDQELACDAIVIERHPRERRTYANAMLKAQLDQGLLPLGCHWSNTHPLHRRIAMLARKSPDSFTRLLGRIAVASIALGFSYSIWAQKPAEPDLAFVPPKKGDVVVLYTAKIGSDVIRRDLPLGAEGKGSKRLVVNGVTWDLDFDIRPKAPDRFIGTFKIARNGELQGHPTMEWLRDGSASTRISNEAGETQFALDVRASILDEDAMVIDANVRENSEALRQSGALDIADAAKGVEIIRQVDGSYRLDNLPKGLSPEEYRLLMEQVSPILHDTMQKNGDAPAEIDSPKAKPATGVSPVSAEFHSAWQIDFMAQANPPDQC